MTKLKWVTKACAVFLLWAAAAIALPAQTFTTLLSFDGANGSQPTAGLVQGIDGNFYGVTSLGGVNNDGTVFKITPTGVLTTLYSFDLTDGFYPESALVQATNGDFYGTTDAGGANGSCDDGLGCGTVFKITPSGTLTTLYSFCAQANCTDGYYPAAALVLSTNGEFYGTTVFGGNSSCAPNGCGTVFKITPSGTLTTLHSFDQADGAQPWGVLAYSTNGDLYGTTSYGGPHFEFGTVFKITPSGTLTTLRSFDSTDGENPYAGLIQGTDGNFYGPTYGGGIYGGGTVFEITPGGTLTTLHSFNGTDGSDPQAALVLGTDGNLYGTTSASGAHMAGTIFEITSSGALTTLYNFCSQSGCTDGGQPHAELVQGTNGEFYGTTYAGGANGYGTVFSLNVGLGQFLETLPTSGRVGAHVKILGSFLTGATSVTFNGTAATFTVNSKSEITTTVPTGATTGTVQVITPRSGTLSSNVPFTVRP